MRKVPRHAHARTHRSLARDTLWLFSRYELARAGNGMWAVYLQAAMWRAAVVW